MYATTTDLLEDLDDGEHRAALYLYRWADAGVLRPVERHRNKRYGAAWPDWTPRMIRLALLELHGPGHHARTMVDVLADTAGALELEPDAAFVTILADGTVDAHRDADTVAHLCTTTGNVVIVAIPN